MKSVSIIIVNYNVKEFLPNLIQSISKAVKNVSSEIIIVDNASQDGSAEFICNKFPFITLIENRENLGFSKANNIGLKVATGEYLLLLNPDTILSEDTIDVMIKFFDENPDAGIAGCKILNPDGSFQLACRRSFPGPWNSFCKVTGLSSLFPGSRVFAKYNLTYLNEYETYEVDAISGSFMMIKRNVYENVGGLDEQFFMYGEDLDWCYRIQKAGYKVYYVHSTQIIHYKGESTKRSSLDETNFFYNAMHLFVKKHLSSSFLVEMILRSAIFVRKFFSFLGRRKVIITAILLDFVSFNLSIYIAENVYSQIRPWIGFPREIFFLVFTIPVSMHILSAAIAGNYKKDSVSVIRNFLSLMIGFLVLSSLTYFIKDYAYSRAVVIFTYIFFFFFSTTWRAIFKLRFLKKTENKFKSRETLIVGTNEAAQKIAEKLKKRHTELYSVAGLIGTTVGDIGKKVGDFEVVGSIENINRTIKEKKIGEVIFTSEVLSYNQMMGIVSRNHEQNVEFKIVGDNLDFIVGKASTTILDDVPLIDLTYNISMLSFRIIKRTFDLLLSVFVLFFIYPLIYFISKVSNKKTDFRKFVLEVPKIIKGRASFVGPQTIINNSKLYLGKKGLTGLWYTEDAVAADHEKLNIFYAKNQNVWLDLEILGKTLSKMWRTGH